MKTMGRRFIKSTAINFIAFSLLFCGCSADTEQLQQKKPGVYISGVAKTVDEMASEDVIVSINGKKITKKDFADFQHLQEKLYKVVNFREGELDKKASWFVKANEQRVIPILMRSEFVRQAANESQIKVSPLEFDEVAKVLLPKYGFKTSDFNKAASKLDKLSSDQLYNIISQEALLKKVVRHYADDKWFTVSPQEVTNQFDYVKKFNDTADKMNRRAKELLLKARAEILSGALFADVAKRYSELHPDQGKEWQIVELDDLSSEGERDLRKWLATADTGDISEPMDFDDGISIVGVVRKGEGESPQGVTPPVLYTLVRCTMYARQNMVIPTYDEVVASIREAKELEAMKEVGQQFHDKAVLEFPNGTNFFNRVTGVINEK